MRLRVRLLWLVGPPLLAQRGVVRPGRMLSLSLARQLLLLLLLLLRRRRLLRRLRDVSLHRCVLHGRPHLLLPGPGSRLARCWPGRVWMQVRDLWLQRLPRLLLLLLLLLSRQLLLLRLLMLLLLVLSQRVLRRPAGMP